MSEWIDPDDAPKLTKEILEIAELRIGDKVIRPARGKLGPNGVVWFDKAPEADEAA